MEGCSKWEFDCPQFVDFAAGLENSSPDNNFPRSSKLVSEPSLTSSLIGNVDGPKMATPNQKLTKMVDLRNSPFINTVRQTQTDDEKLAKLGKNHRRMSRSDGFLDKIGATSKAPENNNRGRKFFNKAPKRSFSEECFKRRKLCPTTPMCLKRTLSKAKSKGKTTEELELEKINVLRNQVSKQLKLNQVNFKRAVNKQNPYAIDDLYKIQRKALPSTKGTKEQPLPMPVLRNNNGKGRCFAENRVENTGIPKEENLDAILKIKGEKLQKVLNKVRASSQSSALWNINANEKDIKARAFGKVQAASQSSALRDINANEKDMKPRDFRKVPFQKQQTYSGIKFCPTQAHTIPHPFSFDSSSASLPNASFKMSDSRACFSTSSWTPNLTANKENVFVENKPRSAF